MGYAMVPLVASVVLMIYHLVATDASRRSKIVVASVVLASLVVWWGYPRWIVVATVAQAGASIYMLVHLRLRAVS